MSPAAPPTPPRRAISRIDSFRHAFAGWWYVLRTQRNAWIHAVISTAVFVAGLWLGLNRTEWAIIILTMATVWMAARAALDLPKARAAAAAVGGWVAFVVVSLLFRF